MIYYDLNAKEKIITSILYGEVTIPQLMNLIEKLVSIDDESGGYKGVTVLCGNIHTSGVSGASLIQLGKQMSAAKFRKGGKNAIIAHTKLGFGLARIYETLVNISGEDEAKVFKGNAFIQALAWLDILEKKDEIQSLISQFGEI